MSVLDRAALQRALQAQGSEWYALVSERCPHLFADVAVLITAKQMQQMLAVIGAVERVVALSKESRSRETLGVFYGYDFHLNSGGAHLIEINSNAGGGFLNALLLNSQRAAVPDLERVFIEMFYNEWRLTRGDAPLGSIAIVDERPEEQYLYPEFLLAQRMFRRAGIAAHIADPAVLHASRNDHEGADLYHHPIIPPSVKGEYESLRDFHGNGLYLESSGDRIDMIYNRLTDFSLQQHPVLRQAYLDGSVVLTPDPAHYARYADKRNLARLTDAKALSSLGANDADIAILQAGIPLTRIVDGSPEQWWQERKQWFFKPRAGYGSKGSYSGAKLTRRVFDEIMQGGYVAQRMAAPGECCVGERVMKYDLRCYVYDGQVQLVAARIYQGQTTNFRTPGGGFAPVYQVE